MSEGQPFQPAASHKDKPEPEAKPVQPEPEAGETTDDIDALIAEADGVCEAAVAKCAQVSESDAGRKAEMAEAKQQAAEARGEVERERGFRSAAEYDRDRLAEALKRVTARLKEAVNG